MQAGGTSAAKQLGFPRARRFAAWHTMRYASAYPPFAFHSRGQNDLPMVSFDRCPRIYDIGATASFDFLSYRHGGN